ncbi:3-isopropylmalate dehydratase small subunit [Jiangella endophytica]|uniref:3-isopropylmalate dehydratase small subunit n=1 Tax=Jiangella endophytica TaxID=1623398 RepID=UPI000E356D1A|nr:3-isopropylmalate dehydratase small subunit [Jiangella endophytica]
MEKITTHTGVGIPLRRSQVDTDQIVPSRFLKRVSRTGFQDALFAGWRLDPGFVLNQEPYRTGSVLVAGSDFGIGSSREHAVWALRDHGVKAVLSSRFGDIFRGNAGTQGLVTGQVAQSGIEALWDRLERTPGTRITVDLRAREVRCAGLVVPFAIDDHTRWRIMNGLDDIDLTLGLDDAIAAFEATRPGWRPRTLPARHHPATAVTPARRTAG